MLLCPPFPPHSSVLALKFVPVFMGSAFKNRGVQLLLDGVTGGLCSPMRCIAVLLNLWLDAP